jgi:hypothetical protein
MSQGPDGVAPGGSFRALAVSLRVGAVYDFVFAGLMLAAPGLLERVFALPLPGEAFYLRLIAVFLTILGATYLVAARDPERFRPLVASAVLGRLAGAVALADSALGEPRLAGLWGTALGDFAFAVIHAALGRRLWR